MKKQLSVLALLQNDSDKFVKVKEEEENVIEKSSNPFAKLFRLKVKA